MIIEIKLSVQQSTANELQKLTKLLGDVCRNCHLTAKQTSLSESWMEVCIKES